MDNYRVAGLMAIGLGCLIGLIMAASFMGSLMGWV